MTEGAPPADDAVSPWIRRWSNLVPPRGSVLDLACGSGRHLRWFAAGGCRVTGVDRDAAATEALRPLGEIVVADLETGPWPLTGRRFDAVVVTRYLWRPLLPTLVESVAPGGVLLYETFSLDQRTIGRPANPDFLLRPGELLGAVAGLRVIAFEDGLEPANSQTPPRFTQRIVAAREPAAATAPRRYPLG